MATILTTSLTTTSTVTAVEAVRLPRFGWVSLLSSGETNGAGKTMPSFPMPQTSTVDETISFARDYYDDVLRRLAD